ncbi:MAG: rRNA pseudouridine synthase [Prevotella sp.]|nr:rRNA pseudouridine synthase [Prevotella sp.]
MDFENENKDQLNEQQSASRDGYQSDFRPVGRSPRPRISHSSPRPQGYDRTNSYNRYQQRDDEGAFRPEGFGSSLQQQPREQRPYRARTFNNNMPYQQRGGYQQGGGYRPRYNQEGEEGGYQPRQQYQPRQGYKPRQQSGDYQQGGYQQRPGGYQPRQQRPYNSNYGQGGYQQGPRKPYQKRPRTADYDPNAKYSMKKRIEYKEVNFDPNEPIRLNKFLANAGICSRREADEFIQAGVVSVNGQVVTELGTKVLRTDVVRFHEDPVSMEKKVYVLLNKPKDYVTTSDDPQQRKTVMDLVKGACPERIYPVGRLDRNTTGVLLLTNDGDLASKLTHPKYLKKKIYHVYLDRNVTAHDMQAIATGVMLEDGEVKADDVQYADANDKKQVGIEIHSGKNRIVRRIFESLGYRVQKLDRVQFAGLTKKNLRRGDWRYLTEEEVDQLRMGAYE